MVHSVKNLYCVTGLLLFLSSDKVTFSLKTKFFDLDATQAHGAIA